MKSKCPFFDCDMCEEEVIYHGSLDVKPKETIMATHENCSCPNCVPEKYKISMTLRDAFAIAVMPVIMRDYSVKARNNEIITRPDDAHMMAKEVYIFSDALLKAREAK